MKASDFEEFSASFDLHNLSHRALLKVLIPRWLEESEGDLDERISNAAYGETPKELQDMILDLFSLTTTDRFLDLGAGAGGFVARLLSLGISAYGIEQNPALVQTGQHFLEQNGNPACHLIEGDFLSHPWPEATVAYAASARFSEAVLEQLAGRIDRHQTLRAMACLGKPLPLSSHWQLVHTSRHQVCWNRGESPLPEILFGWLREPPG
ncbi:MAG: class I SAM-dependent methyltransferase [Vulcanimicrobiota bacterium]